MPISQLMKDSDIFYYSLTITMILVYIMHSFFPTLICFILALIMNQNFKATLKCPLKVAVRVLSNNKIKKIKLFLSVFFCFIK